MSVINVDKKVLLYRIRRAMPILGLAGASLLPCACSKDKEPVNPEQPVAPVDTVDNRYDVTVNWGYSTYLERLTPTIAAAAANPDVRYVILESDGSNWGGALTVSDLRNILVQPMIDACAVAPNKLKHQGTIYRPSIHGRTSEEYKQQQQDSAFLANLGYSLVDPLYVR